MIWYRHINLMENSPKTTCKTVLLVIFPIGIICTDLWAEAQIYMLRENTV